MAKTYRAPVLYTKRKNPWLYHIVFTILLKELVQPSPEPQPVAPSTETLPLGLSRTFLPPLHASMTTNHDPQTQAHYQSSELDKNLEGDHMSWDNDIDDFSSLEFPPSYNRELLPLAEPREQTLGSPQGHGSPMVTHRFE